VSRPLPGFAEELNARRGLDAAGKTTICKKLLNENIEEVSPTLGFIIRTIDYDGLVDSQPNFAF